MKITAACREARQTYRSIGRYGDVYCVIELCDSKQGLWAYTQCNSYQQAKDLLRDSRYRYALSLLGYEVDGAESIVDYGGKWEEHVKRFVKHAEANQSE